MQPDLRKPKQNHKQPSWEAIFERSLDCSTRSKKYACVSKPPGGWVTLFYVVLYLALNSLASAKVNYYANCELCHSGVTGATSVSSTSLMKVNPRLDGGDPSNLPCYTASPGDTLTVTLKATPPGVTGDSFGFAITGNTVGGVMVESITAVNGIMISQTNRLIYTVSGTDWAFQNPHYSNVADSPYCTQGPISWQSGSATRSFQIKINSFTPPDVYSLTCRCAGTDTLRGATWTQSQEFLINVLPGKPIVTTGSATSIGNHQATLNGSVNPIGVNTSAYFQYGTTTAYGHTTPVRVVGNTSSSIPYYEGITGLEPATTYHFQLIASSTNGTTKGADRTFTTLGPPTVMTGPAPSITFKNVVVSGTVSPNGLATTYYFEYGDSSGYGLVTGSVGLSASSSKTRVTGTLASLSPSTLYHYRVVASNSLGLVSGSDKTFTTPPPPSTNADLSNLSLSAGVLAPSFSKDILNYDAAVANRVGSVKVTPAHADANSTIAVRANAAAVFTPVNSGAASSSLALAVGDNPIEVKVTAQDETTSKLYSIGVHRCSAPATLPVSVDLTTAALQGTIDARAQGVFFQYGTSSSYGGNTPFQTIASGTGSLLVSSTLSGLLPAALYHYRIAATTLGVTDYGPDRTFVTVRSYPEQDVVNQGAPAPCIGGNAVFRTFGNPAINYANPDNLEDSDHWAFQALISGSGISSKNNSGIWLFSGSGAALIARTGDPAPGGGTFASLRDPVFNNHDELAFLGTVTGIGYGSANNLGIWATTSGSLQQIAITQVPLDNSGVKASAFLQMVLPESGNITFLANLVSGTGGVTSKNNQGVWTWRDGQLVPLIRKGDVLAGGTVARLSLFAAPALPLGVTGQSRNFSGTGRLSLLANFTNGGQGAFLLDSGSTWLPIAIKGNPAPEVFGAPAIFGAIGNPILNENANAAFQAVLTGTAKGAAKYPAILTSTGTGALLSLVALSGTFAPDTTGVANSGLTFASFGDPVFNRHDAVAFIGKLKPGGSISGANAQGIWASSSGTLKLIAQAQAQAPECPNGVKFSSFLQLALPDESGVVFLASLSGPGVTGANNQGIWLVDSTGTIHLIARTGDALLINGMPKIVSKLSLFTSTAGTNGQSRSFNQIGDLIYKVIFTDKTQTVWRALTQ